MVDNELRTLLQKYLDGEQKLDDVRSWVALNIFEASPDTENDVDRLAIELSHLDDGTADESYFRNQVAGMLVVVVELHFPEWETASQLPSGSSVTTVSTVGPATPTIVPVQEFQFT